MLYLRSLKLVNCGDRKNPRMYLRCGFTASKNKYSKSFPVNIFEDSSLGDVFTALCTDFSVEEEDKIYPVECSEVFEGDVFTADCAPHYVTDADNKKIKDSDGNDIIATSITSVFVSDFGQTKESVIRSFERTWAKNDLLVSVEEE